MIASAETARALIPKFRDYLANESRHAISTLPTLGPAGVEGTVYSFENDLAIKHYHCTILTGGPQWNEEVVTRSQQAMDAGVNFVPILEVERQPIRNKNGSAQDSLLTYMPVLHGETLKSCVEMRSDTAEINDFAPLATMGSVGFRSYFGDIRTLASLGIHPDFARPTNFRFSRPGLGILDWLLWHRISNPNEFETLNKDAVSRILGNNIETASMHEMKPIMRELYKEILGNMGNALAETPNSHLANKVLENARELIM